MVNALRVIAPELPFEIRFIEITEPEMRLELNGYCICLLYTSLGGVVEDCVNKVGVDLNTASASLLEYVSGISKTLAKNIVAYREENLSLIHI